MDPFVVVLEGVNGTGKTTIAQALSHAYRFSHNARTYRVFPEAKSGTREGVELSGILKDVGIPLNTHVDDFYAVDAIRNLSSPGDMVILDRSLPSGLAYARSGIDRQGTVSGDSRMIASADQRARDASPERVLQWIRQWSSLIPNRLYVTLLVSYDESRRRAHEQARTRWHPTREQHDRLDSAFRLYHAMVGGSKLLIETDHIDIDQVLSRIAQYVPPPKYGDDNWHANQPKFGK